MAASHVSTLYRSARAVHPFFRKGSARKTTACAAFSSSDRSSRGSSRPVALFLHRGFHSVNRKVERDCDRELYKLRNEVERLSRRLKGRRRIYMRFDKLDAMLLGFLNLALVVEMMHDLAQKGPKSYSHCPFSSFKRGSRTKNAFQQSGSDQSSNTAHHSSLVAAAFAIDQHERHVFELVFTR